MEKLTQEQKEYYAEIWYESRKDFSDFYTEFVEQFRLNLVQCCALKRLCDLVEYHTEIDTKMRINGMTSDEAIKLYKNTKEEQVA